MTHKDSEGLTRTRNVSQGLTRTREDAKGLTILTGQIAVWQWIANSVADLLAEQAAIAWQLDENIVEDINRIYRQAASIRRRLVEVHRIWFHCLTVSDYKFHNDVSLLDTSSKRPRIEVGEEARNDPTSPISRL